MLAQTAARAASGRSVPQASSARNGNDFATALQSIGTVCRFERNQTVFSDGDDAVFSYKVVSGAVRLIKLMADGRRVVAGFRLAGDIFGIEWSGEYALTAEAVTPVNAIRYARASLERLGEERVEVRQELTNCLRYDLKAAHDHMVSLGCQSAKERVASFLRLLADRAGAKAGAAIETPMGRQDIADYLGLTIETVCRTLSELKEQRVIDIPNRHQIVVRDIEKLEAIIDAETWN